MQIIGPSNEMIYLTKVMQPANVEFDIGTAESFVDRVFIVIAGARDHRALMNFYRSRLKLQVTEPVPYRIPVLSQAHSLPEDRMHNLALAVMPDQFFLELDEYPPGAVPRPIPPGKLPPGIAMVTFEVKSLEDISIPFISSPIVHDSMPYNDRRTATLRGAAGELIELVESRSKRSVSTPHGANQDTPAIKPGRCK